LNLSSAAFKSSLSFKLPSQVDSAKFVSSLSSEFEEFLAIG
jgi:hypothetical protein